MSTLEIMLGIAEFSPTFREVGKVEIVDGKPKPELKPETISRKNRGGIGCLHVSEQASKRLRAAIVADIETGQKYTAKTMATQIGFAQSAVRRHLQAMVKSGELDCETITHPNYKLTWYWKKND